MKKLLFTIAILFIGTFAANAQSQCPADMVCITREAAIKALTDSDSVKALTIENAKLTQAIADKTKDLSDMKIEFARVSGENTGLKENAVSDRAIMTVLVQNSKKKCMPLSVCF